ncbi:MAG: guanylate kinase [Bdellovibrionales bacterium CG10_big_fil_rev_8_21_14_0_10_45_34]|nr:MAG: guanylate kinase [Bdellovibrionales bacterium CG10_big_fil_rev_8_21_14_0_10_45_34]
MKPPLIIVSAPSGAGKSTLCQRALKEIPNLVDSISYTTRPPRATESEGAPYHFVSKEQFEVLKKDGFFAETALVHENWYGTPRYQIEEAHNNGKVLIMDVDVKGAMNLKNLYPTALSIFILPPSIEELKRRLLVRDAGKTQNLDLRLENAQTEMEQSRLFDQQITNENFESAFDSFKKIIENALQRA